jgi:hypothetical protein
MRRGAVVAEAIDVIETGKPKTLEFSVADETAWKVGLSCGGTIRVYVEKSTRVVILKFLHGGTFGMVLQPKRTLGYFLASLEPKFAPEGTVRQDKANFEWDTTACASTSSERLNDRLNALAASR